MDSLLNLAYNNLHKKLPLAETAALKREEIQWLKKRDAYFKKLIKDDEIEAGYKRSEWGEMWYEILYSDEAKFIKERAIVLIKRLNK